MFPGAILCGGSWTGAGSGIRVARRVGGEGGGGLISVFGERSASVGEVFIFAGGLGAGLSFYGISALSWYFLSSWDFKA